MEEKLAGWLQQFEKKQHLCSAEKIKAAIDFLLQTRVERDGWGLYPGVPAELRFSALAVEALHRCGTGAPVIADVVLHYRTDLRLQSLGVPEIVDLIAMARCEVNPDAGYSEAAVERLRELSTTIQQQPPAASVVTFARGCIALAGIQLKPATRLLMSWSKHLVDCQLPDGHWPASSGETSSLVATAFATRALSRTGNKPAQDAAARGLDCLQRIVADTGWQGIGDKWGIYALAVVLHAVSEGARVPYKLIEDGAHTILRTMNADGGWGGGPGEPSNSECTAVTILALISTGANRFVPARLAEAAVRDGDRLITELVTDRDQLKADFDRKVQAQCGRILGDRDKLKTEVDQLQKQLASTKAAAENEAAAVREKLGALRMEFSMQFAEQSARGQLGNRRRNRFESLAPILTSLLGIGLVLLIQLQIPTVWRTGIEIVIMVVITSSLILWTYDKSHYLRAKVQEMFNLRAAETTVPTRLFPKLDYLRRNFFEISRGWPEPLVEEVVYRLYKEVSDMPPDIAARYTDDLLGRLRMPSDAASSLLRWMDLFVELGPTERRIVLNQIRDRVLPT